jgi:phenylalanyl-tRNA synthetase beta chain
MRFEKALDPANTERGLARAIDLLQEVSPGIRVVGGIVDARAEFPAVPKIEVKLDWLARKLGRAVTVAEVRAILESLQFGVEEPVGGLLSVRVPSWRATKDITLKEDILEEVGRMLGYDSVTPTAPLVKTTVPPSNPERAYQRRLRLLVVDQGYTEVSNYSFISEEMARRFGFDPAEHARVINPIASDQALMRTSLLPGIWKNIAENSKHLTSFRFFEIGYEIHPRPGALPEQVPHLMAAVYAREGDGTAGLFELKRLAECILPGCSVTATHARGYEHPERSAWIVSKGVSGGAPIGRLFELHPSLLEGRAAIVDLDLHTTMRFEKTNIRHRALRRYPTSAFDLSVVSGLREPVGTIHARLREASAGDVESIEFVRQYTGDPLAPDRKSVSFRLTVGAPDRTLSSDEVSSTRTRIIESMRAFGYDLRV